MSWEGSGEEELPALFFHEGYDLRDGKFPLQPVKDSSLFP